MYRRIAHLRIALLILCAAAGSLRADQTVPIVVGQRTDFQTGTLEGWFGCCPLTDVTNPNAIKVILGGGPNGAGDHYMLITSDPNTASTAGSRSATFYGPYNSVPGGGPNTQWDNNYITNGINAIAVDLYNFSDTAANMRLDFTGSQTEWITENHIQLAPNSGWQRLIFSIRYQDMYNAGNNGDQTLDGYNNGLSNPFKLRIIQDSTHHFPPETFTGQIGVDNITALTENRFGWNNGTSNFNAAGHWRENATPVSGTKTHLVFGQNSTGGQVAFGTGPGQTAAFTADNDLPGLGGNFDLYAMTLDGQAGLSPGVNTIGSSVGAAFRFVNHDGILPPTLINQGQVDYTIAAALRATDHLVIGGAGSGNVTLAGGITTTGFLLTKRGDWTLDLNGGSLNIDQLHIEGGRVAVHNANLALTDLNNTGTLHVGAGVTVSVANALTQQTGATLNAGGYRVDAGGSLVLSTGANITTNNGSVILSGAGSIFAKIDALTDNQGGFEVNSGRNFTVSAAFSNTGSLRVDTGSTFTASSTTAQLDGGALSAGTWFIGSGATLDLAVGANILTNQANVILSGPGSSFARINTLNNNQGGFEINSGRNFTTAGALANSGVLTIDSGSTLTATGLLTNTGLIIGAGAVAGTVDNQGTLRSHGGTFSFSGGITQLSTSTLTGGSYFIERNSSLDLAASPAITHTAAPVSITFDGSASQFAKLNTLTHNAGLITLTNGAAFSPSTALNNTGTILMGPSAAVAPGVSLANQSGGLIQGEGTINASVSNQGSIIVNAGKTLWIAQAAANSGDIALTNTASILSVAAGLTNSSAGLIHGLGSITGVLNNNATVRADAPGISGDALVIQADGAGSGAFILQNADATLVFSGALNFTAGSSFSGDGLIQFSGGTQNIVSNFNLGSTGRISVTGSTLNLNSGAAITSSGSSLTLGSGGGRINVNTNLSLGSAQLVLSGGTFGGGGTLSVNNLVWTGSTLADNGGLTVNSGGSATLAGGSKNLSSNRAFTNNGSLTQSHTGALTGGAATILNNNASGSWTNTSNPTFSGSGAFNNAGHFSKITGAGVTNFTSGWNFNNTGTVTVSSGTLTLNTVAQQSGSTLTGGAWRVSGGTLNFNTGVNFTTNQGTVILSTATSNFAKINALASNQGTFQIDSGRNFTTAGAFANDGSLIVGSSSTFTLAPGASLTNSATAVVKGAGSITASGGGTIINNGTFAPGLSPGNLTLNSDYSSTGSSHLAIEVGGTAVGTQFDRLTVSGTTALAGSLDISLINGFDPTPLQTFTILTGSSVTGSFSSITLVGSTTKRFATAVNATSVVLTAVSKGDLNADGLINAADIDLLSAKTIASNPNFTPTSNFALFDLNGDAAVDSSDISFLLNSILHRRSGDADLDGDVDAADLSALRTNLGGVNFSWTNGNFDGDGDIDAADLSIFRSNIGLPPPGLDEPAGDSGFNGIALFSTSSSASIPEPSTLALLTLGSIALIRRRSR